MRFGVGTIETCFLHCKGISPVGGAKEAIASLQQVGGEFIRLIDLQPHPDPTERIDAKGNIFASALSFRHPALQMDAHTLTTVHSRGLSPDTKPWAGFSFIQESRYISFVQSATPEDRSPRLVDRIALGQLSLACDLYPLMRPKYGWIDELGFNLPKEHDIAANKLRLLLWANFFGPEFVQLLGKDFLAGAPGWRLVDLEDGGCLYVVTESYLEWYEMDQEEILSYFRRKVPEMQRYRAYTYDGAL
jgi:hypothetical protein